MAPNMYRDPKLVRGGGGGGGVQEGGLPDCSGGETREEGVLLQYSVDGGITWRLLQEMAPNMYRDPK